MQDTIQNNSLSVSVKRHGAELCNLRGADGLEYLWQADPAIWASHAPFLFPVIGRLADDRYCVGGRSYSMKKHGFARLMDFDRVEKGAATLSYRLESSASTWAQYPFDFVLIRHYRLNGLTLDVVNEVTNTGKEPMPFSMGEHPGFALNWNDNDRIEDYYLEFDKPETLDSRRLDESALLSNRTVRVLSNERMLPLHRDLFNEDALIFLKLESRKVTLASRKSSRRLSVEFPDYPQLGIWAKPGAAYVCIEPWAGYADPTTHDGELMTKPGIVMLGAGQSKTFLSRITIIEA